MKTLYEMLDVTAQTDWITISVLANSSSTQVNPWLNSLKPIMKQTLEFFSESYDRYKLIPPGLNETLRVMAQVASCNNDKELAELLTKQEFVNELEEASKQVEKIKSKLNYALAALQLIGALALFCVAAPTVFLTCSAAGLMAGLLLPISSLFLVPLAAIPTYHLYKLGSEFCSWTYDLIRRTQHENSTEGKIVSQMGLFKENLKAGAPTPSLLNPGECSEEPNPAFGI